MTIAQSIHEIAPYKDNSFQTLKSFIDNAYGDVHFLGWYVVKSRETHESIGMRTLVLKIMEMVKGRMLTGDEFAIFEEARTSIYGRLETESSERSKTVNIVTKIFIWIRDNILANLLIVDDPGMYTTYLMSQSYEKQRLVQIN